MKVKLTLVMFSALTLTLTPELAVANTEPTPSVGGIQAVELPDGTHRITLTRESQPKPERPTINRLTAEAKNAGADLRPALEKYARDLAVANPSEVADQPDGPAYYPPVKIDGIRIEELIDLGQVAEDEGIPHVEAINRYAWQTDLQAVHNKLESTFPDEASGTSLLNDGRTARIGFKGKIPELALQLARSLPGEVELIGDKGFSKKELREALESSSRELGKRAEVAGYVGNYDIDTGVIRFEVEPQKDLKDRGKRAAVLSALQLQSPANPRMRIEIELTDDLNLRPAAAVGQNTGVAADDPYLRGGGILASGTTGTIWNCTGGFNVIRSDGYHSTTSARHCWDLSGDQYWFYFNHPNYTGNRTTLGFTQNASRQYDFTRLVQSGSISLTFTRTFYAALNRPRYVTTNGTSPVDGSRVCFFGRTSHTTDGAYTCGNIVDSDVTYRMAGISGDWFGAIQTIFDGPVSTQGGDSGGPLWYGNTAWGITSTGGSMNLFVATDRINDTDGLGTNWNVWTCPTC
ncbi:hypothetical protein FH608_050810 [Nonomuraea phyllanthi]|uniref:Trypsin-like serine protease n=1 Tax=Nonomuraea phyllanthi TaxID=2219224 RepID=A0A5C4USF1_9ACTN|nr:S1 family peptidase [Nonomuraea phyllanthi]KAB8181538.1 hypothetical protein FH608_050810 [Nonomuraea phyllanthi]